MKMTILRSSIVVAACIAGLGLGGCVSAQTTGAERSLESGVSLIEIENASYEEVFAATREVLSSFRFGINRIDASRGVITTFPKRTAGLASIWDREQSSLGQELEDLTNQQERTVRVVFEPNEDGVAVRAHIEVMVFRVHRPHWRVESESIRFSTHAKSRDSAGKAEPGEFREPIGQDLALAQRIANELVGRFE